MAIRSKIKSPIFSSCSLLMGILFAYSASVQLNDHDWYFWLPLYALASVVNVMSIINCNCTHINQLSLLVLYGGTILLLKVLAESQLYGFWSMNMKERVVREKIGSGLVVISMSLHLKVYAVSEVPKRSIRNLEQKNVASGMAILGALSFGLCLYFFLFIGGGMKL